MVDEDRARRHAREGAAVADRHRAQIVVIADAGKDEFGAVRRFGRRRESFGAGELGHEFLRLRHGAIIDAHLVAGAMEMAGHGIAHDPKADESDDARV